MVEASWSGGASRIDWSMSAALRNVPRGDTDVAEVTSLERAVREWLTLDAEHRADAVLTPEHPVQTEEGLVHEFHGAAIGDLAEALPGDSFDRAG